MVYARVFRSGQMMRRRLGASICFLGLDSYFCLCFAVGSNGVDGDEEAIIFDSAAIAITLLGVAV